MNRLFLTRRCEKCEKLFTYRKTTRPPWTCESCRKNPPEETGLVRNGNLRTLGTINKHLLPNLLGGGKGRG